MSLCLSLSQRAREQGRLRSSVEASGATHRTSPGLPLFGLAGGCSAAEEVPGPMTNPRSGSEMVDMRVSANVAELLPLAQILPSPSLIWWLLWQAERMRGSDDENVQTQLLRGAATEVA